MAANEDENHLPPWLAEGYEAVPAVDTSLEQSKQDFPLYTNNNDNKIVSNEPIPSYQNEEEDPFETTPLTQKAREKKSKIEEFIQKKTRRGCCQTIFILINILSISSSTCLLISQALPFIFISKPDILQIALRCYVGIFTILFALSECELSCFQSIIGPTVDNWVYKGIIQSFIGLVGIEESLSLNFDGGEEGTDIYQTSASIFIIMSSYMMIASGVIYFVMGLFCLRGLRDRCRNNYNERLKEANKIEMNV